MGLTVVCLFLFCVKYFPDRFVRREILNFKVICTNKSLGCPWEGTLSNYEVNARIIMNCFPVYVYTLSASVSSRPCVHIHMYMYNVHLMSVACVYVVI